MNQDKTPYHAVVVGAGAAGLAAAAMLKRAGVEVVMLDRADAVGDSWRRRYDRLRLNTARFLSGLPGFALDRRYGPWVSRDDFVLYLERYARHHDLAIRHGVEIQRIDRVEANWRLATRQGEFTARTVVVATGFDHTPTIPEWPGRETFTGRLLHSVDYRNPAPFRGQDVLVVGTGSTGNELATDLLEGGARRVRVSMHTPANTFPRQWFGVPTSAVARLTKRLPALVSDRLGFLVQRLIWGDLSRYGLPRASEGIASSLAHSGHGIAVDGGLIDALKRGDIELVAGVEGFEGPNVILADGTRLAPDVVIAATGYRQGLEPLVGHLGVLAPNGRPTIVGAQTVAHAPGLHFIGYRLPVSGQLPEISGDAHAIAHAVVYPPEPSPRPRAYQVRTSGGELLRGDA